MNYPNKIPWKYTLRGHIITLSVHFLDPDIPLHREVLEGGIQFAWNFHSFYPYPLALRAKKVVCCYLREELCAQTLGTGMAKICIAVNTEVTILLTE